MAKVSISSYGIQNGTERTCYAKWTWTKSNTDYYRVYWYYYPGSGNGSFIGNIDDVDGTTGGKQSTYNAPSNAYQVKFKVKPVSKKHKVNGTSVSYWTADYTALKTINLNKVPLTPPTPTVSVDGQTLTATLNNLDVQATYIKFNVVRDDSKSYKTINCKISTNAASCSCALVSGHTYKVRARSYTGSTYSDWSDYSSELTTAPDRVSKWTDYYAQSSTGVYLAWGAPTGATSYTVEYTMDSSYFDSSTSNVSSVNTTVNHTEITGLDTGQKWYFRVQAVNDQGVSAWSSKVSITIGTTPEAPTTWQSRSTAVIGGEDVILYWTHNTEDGSAQKEATIEINGKEHILSGSTSQYSISPGDYSDGDEILWRVKTQGITGEYGAWSAYRSVSVYAQPTLGLDVTDALQEPGLIQSYPMQIIGYAGPESQTPLGYNVSIIALAGYETVDEIGETKKIAIGTVMYQKYIDASGDLDLVLSAGDIDLENNQIYSAIVTVTMNSGLTASETCDFSITWDDDVAQPDAQIGIDFDDLSAHIHPYCTNPDEDFAIDWENGATLIKIDYLLATSASEDEPPGDGEIMTSIVGEAIVGQSRVGVSVTDPAVWGASTEQFDDICCYLWIVEQDTYDNGFVKSGDPFCIGRYPDAAVATRDFCVTETADYIGTGFTDESPEYTGSDYLWCRVTVDGESVSQWLADDWGSTASEYDINLAESMTLSVYRRNFDGGFTLIESDIDNAQNLFIVDPHPALDFARYRIVARSSKSGMINFYDMPGYPIGEKSIVIQWDETWTDYQTDEESEMEEPARSGSMVKLPYNVDTSDQHGVDVDTISYIGRERPVSYYGTQKTTSATWKTEILKTDLDTLYALRRLSTYMGDAYVREPTGAGYWATVAVSFSKTHNELTIPVSFAITRVEGGA